MRNFHIKSILLGMGIGMVLISIVSMIYTSGIKSYQEMSREEIISKAREYGMVDASLLAEAEKRAEAAAVSAGQPLSDNNEALKPEDNSGPSDEEQHKAPEKELENQPSGDAVQQPEPPSKVINIVVEAGTTAMGLDNLLLQNGLIGQKNDFTNRLKELKLTGRIRTGRYNIAEGTGVDEIIRIVTKRQ